MWGTAGLGDDAVATYSRKCPAALDWIVKPDLVAPGNRIGAAMAAGSGIGNANRGLRVAGGYPGSKYIRLSGASMAAPMAAGVAALLLQREPDLTPARIKARLMRTASKAFPASSTATGAQGTFTTYHDTLTTGADHLDIAAALGQSGGGTEGSISPTRYG